MTKKTYEELEKNNVKLEADGGRLVQFWNSNAEITSWFDKNTFKFATLADYEKFGLEALSYNYGLEQTKKKYAGKEQPRKNCGSRKRLQ